MYKYNLEHDLIASATVLELVKDDTFALELYGALCNMRWLYLPAEDPESVVQRLLKTAPEDYGLDDAYSASWRYAGGVVADLRNRFLVGENKQEDYMDWYCQGGEGFVTDRIKTTLAAMHWHPLEWGDESYL